MWQKTLTLLTIYAALCFGSCARSSSSADTSGQDLAPRAQMLSLTEKDGYTLAQFFSPRDTVHPQSVYALVPREKDIPAEIPQGATIIRTPIKSLVIYSNVTAAALKELGALEVVKGVVDAQYFTVPEITAGIADGSIVNCGAASAPTAEKVIALHPEAILLNLYDGMNVSGIDAMQIPLVKMVDNYESTPLGRAEWIRLLGALTGTEAKADSIYRTVADNYTQLLKDTRQITKRPKVLTDTMYEGIWYVPGGHSFQARLIADAGGEYFCADDKSEGSLSLNFEQVLLKGRDADVWIIKIFGQDLTHDALLRLNPGYGSFESTRSGNVYYANTAAGSLFDDMVYHPDKILSDYAAIFRAVSNGEKATGLHYFKSL